ncbi:MAG TPA: glycoside hydrolase family 27 protein [Terriglobales bacterium]|nr:glycoside hydrolase family 27 protein [Terriglobales bacterium]
MKRGWLLLISLFLTNAVYGQLAATPPMGWNSWDGYGTTIKEADVKANANWLAKHLKSSGWQYVVVDMEWYVTNPTPEGNSKTFDYVLDGAGRYMPAVNRFPSAANGAGFKPLADYIHSLGLKFGIHVLRGIPKAAVAKNLEVAMDAADTSDTCPWNYDNFGANTTKPAATAYYESIAKLYASWGVDLIKVDCIASHPYKGDEIRLLSEALTHTGRPIVLSLSPGPAPTEKLDELRQYAQMWRISDDIWDIWHSDVRYPQGLGDQFANVARWAGKAQPGHWPDADMLPLGYLGPAAGWGDPRATRLTHDERKTLMTLWSIFPSPLMVGGDLTKADAWTTSLLTTADVIEMDQHSKGNHPVVTTDKIVVWTAESSSGGSNYVAVFNISDAPQDVRYGWKELGLSVGSHRVRDIWEGKDLDSWESIAVKIPSHGVALYRVN